ncbi:MAG: CHAT domain-containing protein [Oscillochloridaceae bacterium umkhey_bin13]
MTHYDLEISIVPRDREAGTYLIGLRYVPPEQNLFVRIDGREPITFDLEKLLGLINEYDQYGDTLTAQLFAGQDVRDGLMNAISAARQANADLRLRLYIAADATKLHEIRWELLRTPERTKPSFLCVKQRLPFSRYLSSVDWSPMLPRARTALRALIVIAAPEAGGQYSLYPIDRLDEQKRALEYLDSLAECRVIGIEQPATLETLLEHLEDAERDGRPFDLLYLVAHGQIQADTPHLWLEQADRQGEWIDATKLSDGIGDMRERPRLVLLCSCQSAGYRGNAAHTALAPRLAAVGIPAIVAVQDNFSIDSAHLFFPDFFREVFANRAPIDAALAKARRKLERHKRHDWWMPLLYMRLHDGYIWATTTAAPPLTLSEIVARVPQLRASVAQHAPGLLEAFARHALTLNTYQNAAEGMNHAAVRPALAEIERICSLIYDEQVGFAAVVRSDAPPPPPVELPFRGLFHFTAAQRRFFKGRDALVAKLTSRLQQERFLAIVGASGCGKSSLAFAGVAPEVCAVQGAHLIALRPSGRSLITEPEDASSVTQTRTVNDIPGATPLDRLRQLCDVAPTNTPLLIIVDQFEELFTQVPEPDRAPFIVACLNLAKQHYVLLTMRADFWGDCALYDDLREHMQAGQELIKPLQADELRDAIEAQAVEAQLRLEPGLTHLIFADVREEPGAMPLLQHALFELWKRREGRWLRGQPYLEMGGLRGSVAHTAEFVYKKYAKTEQDLIRRLFIGLTRTDRLSVLEGGGRDTRRRVELGDIALSGVDRAQMEQLIDALASERLLVKGEPRIAHDRATTPLELAHEAIIQHWSRMRAWLDADRADLAFFESVRDAAAEWERQGWQSADLLHDGTRAERALAIAATLPVNAAARDQRYLRACRAAEAQRSLAELERTIHRQQADYARNLRFLRNARQTLALYIRPNPEPGGVPYLLTARVPGVFVVQRAMEALPLPVSTIYGGAEQLHAMIFEYDPLALEWKRLTEEVGQTGGMLRLELHLGSPELEQYTWEDLILFWRDQGYFWAEYVVIVRLILPLLPLVPEQIQSRNALLQSALVLNGSVDQGASALVSDAIDTTLGVKIAGTQMFRNGSSNAPTVPAIMHLLEAGVDLFVLHLPGMWGTDVAMQRGFRFISDDGGEAFFSIEQLQLALYDSSRRPRLWLDYYPSDQQLISYCIQQGLTTTAVTIAGNVQSRSAERFFVRFIHVLLDLGDVEQAFRVARMTANNMAMFQLRTMLPETGLSAQKISVPQLMLRVVSIDHDYYDLDLAWPHRFSFANGELDLRVAITEQERYASLRAALERLIRSSKTLKAYRPDPSLPLSIGLVLPEAGSTDHWEGLLVDVLVHEGLAQRSSLHCYRLVRNQRSWKQRAPVQSPPLRILVVLEQPDREVAQTYRKPVLAPEGYQQLLRWTRLIQRFMPTAVELRVLEQSANRPVTPNVLADTLQQGFDMVYWPITARQSQNFGDFLVFMHQNTYSQSDKESGRSHVPSLSDAPAERQFPKLLSEGRYQGQKWIDPLRSLIIPPRLWLLAGDESELLAQELIKEGLAGAVVGVRGIAAPEALQPLFRRLTAEVLRSGRVDVACTRMRQAFSEQEAVDQVVVWSTEEGLNVIDVDTFAQYRSLLKLIAQGERKTEDHHQ